MSISGIGSQTSLIVQSLVDMRSQLDDLQRQLGTGQKSDTYAGVGLDRGLAVGLRSQLSALDGFDNTITNVGVRLTLAQTALGRISDIGHQVKTAAFQIAHGDRFRRAYGQPERRLHPRSTNCSVCSTRRPATATCSPAALPTSRRSRPSTTS